MASGEEFAKKIDFLRWLYIVFLAREAWVQMAWAREYLKKRKTTKINMAARLLSRFMFHLPLSLLSRTTVHQKTARNVLKNTLLSTSPDVAKLRSQFTVLIAPTSEREDRDRKRRSRRVVTVHFLWSEALLWVPLAMKHWKQLECLQRGNWHRKWNHHCVTKRVSSHERKWCRVENQKRGLVG